MSDTVRQNAKPPLKQKLYNTVCQTGSILMKKREKDMLHLQLSPEVAILH